MLHQITWLKRKKLCIRIDGHCTLLHQTECTCVTGGLLCCVLLLSTGPGEGEVRLVGRSGQHEGRVEVYHNGTWGTVCNRGWDVQDATVVCRQLGYGTAVDVPCCAAFGRGSGPIWYDNVRCSGREANLKQCVHGGLGVNNCGHWEDAGVICASE